MAARARMPAVAAPAASPFPRMFSLPGIPLARRPLINAAFTNFFLSSSRFPHDLTKRILSRGVEGKEKGASRALRRLRTVAEPKRRLFYIEKTRVEPTDLITS